MTIWTMPPCGRDLERSLCGRARTRTSSNGTIHRDWRFPDQTEETTMGVGTIILIILVILLLGGFSGIGGGPFYGTGHYGGGVLGLVLVVVLIMVLLGRL